MNSLSPAVLTRLCQDVRQAMALKGKKDDEIEWDVNTEVLFLLSMMGLKPVGVNRHFMMMMIHDKFSGYLNHQISCKKLWDHLETLYDMSALNESEVLPFPNEETDFELPEDCHDLLKSKYGVSLNVSDSDDESSKNSSGSKASGSKKIVTPKPKQANIPVAPKTQLATPSTSKVVQSDTVVRSNVIIKTLTCSCAAKIKKELAMKASMNKEAAAAPVEPIVVAKESSPDILVYSKKTKERGSSPSTSKKSVKVETCTLSSLSKKTKSEGTSTMPKPTKEHTPDSVKKVRIDKEATQRKKDKSTQCVDGFPVSKRSSKESVYADKKKNELESNHKKTYDTSAKYLKSEAKSSSMTYADKKKNELESNPKKTYDTSAKHVKSDAKSSSMTSKVQDVERHSGSRKSSPVMKVKSGESSKNLKPSVKPEEPLKKATSTLKRKRVI